jgi:hypothetical protein
MRAKNFCSKYERENITYEKIDYKIVGRELKKYVKELTDQDIKIRSVDINTKINIASNLNTIQINPHEEFKSIDLERLKIHEIGVHYLRYFNGHQSGIRLLETGTANYIGTEEGLAVYAEDCKGLLSKGQMFIYAGRVIATYYALEKSFYEIFEILKKYDFKDKTAFAITYRAKRNLFDTSLKGGYTKDHVYFKGYEIIKRYAKNKNFKYLMYGKIHIKDIALIKKYFEKYPIEVKTIFNSEKE